MSRQTVTMVTVGTRGDVQPYVALGLGLESVGYQVRIAAPAPLNSLIKDYGLTAFPIHTIDPQTFLGQGGVQDATKQQTPIGQLVALLREAHPLIKDFIEEVWQACQGSDAVIASTIFYGAQDSAEKLEIPCVHTFLHPILSTATVASPLFPQLTTSIGTVNRATHALVNQILWQPFRSTVNAFRKRVGLPPRSVWGPYSVLNRLDSLLLYGFSPTIFPKPRDWPTHAHVTGYWFLDEPEDWYPPNDLTTFLESGPPPIYVGFGSMKDKEADRLMDVVLEALDCTGARGILSSWGSLGSTALPETVFPIASAPHVWLFPRMAAVTHHGGAGTTGAVLRAGVPSIIIPFLGDQLFWAKRAAALGVSPEPITHRKLTAEALAERFQMTLKNQMMNEQARKVGEAIYTEDGVSKAVHLIDAYLRRHIS